MRIAGTELRSRAESRGAKCSSPPPAGFKVQQVQQIHKRPCLQESSEFLKVQQKCNRKCNKVQQGWLSVGELRVECGGGRPESKVRSPKSKVSGNENLRTSSGP